MYKITYSKIPTLKISKKIDTILTTSLISVALKSTEVERFSVSQFLRLHRRSPSLTQLSPSASAVNTVVLLLSPIITV